MGLLTALKSTRTVFEVAFFETLMAWFQEVVFGQGVTLRKGVNNIVAGDPQGSVAYLGK